jgi:hypothetical protein
VEHGFSLTCSQESTTGPCAEPQEFKRYSFSVRPLLTILSHIAVAGFVNTVINNWIPKKKKKVLERTNRKLYFDTARTA